mmetsp:Transcript_19107/g.53258  ORF Transcript_19107/g.53258 Transcript_19107/m.53258 type:complete len:229 (+) Transcript_19107:831-1517(+)
MSPPSAASITTLALAHGPAVTTSTTLSRFSWGGRLQAMVSPSIGSGVAMALSVRLESRFFFLVPCALRISLRANSSPVRVLLHSRTFPLLPIPSVLSTMYSGMLKLPGNVRMLLGEDGVLLQVLASPSDPRQAPASLCFSASLEASNAESLQRNSCPPPSSSCCCCCCLGSAKRAFSAWCSLEEEPQSRCRNEDLERCSLSLPVGDTGAELEGGMVKVSLRLLISALW